MAASPDQRATGSRPTAPPAGPPGPRMGPASRADIELDASEPSLGELISRTTGDLSKLMRDEVALAKVELKEEAKTAGKAGALLGGAGLLGYLALALVCVAAGLGLAELIHPGLAFLVVGLLVAAAAAVAYGKGRSNLDAFDPAPEQTIETIQEDVQWARQLKS